MIAARSAAKSIGGGSEGLNLPAQLALEIDAHGDRVGGAGGRGGQGFVKRRLMASRRVKGGSYRREAARCINRMVKR